MCHAVFFCLKETLLFLEEANESLAFVIAHENWSYIAKIKKKLLNGEMHFRFAPAIEYIFLIDAKRNPINSQN